MAYNKYALARFLVSLVLTTAYPLVQAQSQLEYPIFGVTVTGRFCCAQNGACTPGAAPLSGVLLFLNCTGPFSNVYGSGTTDANGVFNITARIDTVQRVNIMNLSPTLPCEVETRLPIKNPDCPLLNSVTGTLTGTVVTLGLDFLSSWIDGLVSVFVYSGITYG